jgi:hypothetical protein
MTVAGAAEKEPGRFSRRPPATGPCKPRVALLERRPNLRWQPRIEVTAE